MNADEKQQRRVSNRFGTVACQAAPAAVSRSLISFFCMHRLVGHATNQVTLRATVPARIKARFAGNGRSLAKKRNAESCRHSDSRRAVAPAPYAAFRSLDGPARTPALARLAYDAGATAECHLICRMAHSCSPASNSTLSSMPQGPPGQCWLESRRDRLRIEPQMNADKRR